MIDPQIITLVYDEESNVWRVDIGNLHPLIAARTLADAADTVEDAAAGPSYVVVIQGIEFKVELEED